jgi:uncharacterized protein YegJ (DUF2314 family)
MSIIKPSDDAFKPKSVKNAKFTPEAAVKVDTKKGKIAEERQARLIVAENKPDQEYLELFETVKGLIVTKDFWELLPDHSLQNVYAIIVGEMKKRGVSLPKLEEKKAPEAKKLIIEGK